MSQLVVRKADEAEQEYYQVVYAEVYAPNRLDVHNEWMSAEEIQMMAWRFLALGKTTQIDIQHDNKLVKAAVVESFIAREDDSIFIPGSWVVGVYIQDPETWQKVLDGEINGFSMEAWVNRTKQIIKVSFPNMLTGKTTEEKGHVHTWYVRYEEDGTFLGGNTDTVDGHSHDIIAGTKTEEADGHIHLFAAVDDLDLSAELLEAMRIE